MPRARRAATVGSSTRRFTCSSPSPSSSGAGSCQTSGGRVLAVVAQAESFDAAFEQAYAGLAQVHFEGMTYRRDIGHQVRSR